jgi:hypothetical protein
MSNCVDLSSKQARLRQLQETVRKRQREARKDISRVKQMCLALNNDKGETPSQAKPKKNKEE